MKTEHIKDLEFIIPTCGDKKQPFYYAQGFECEYIVREKESGAELEKRDNKTLQYSKIGTAITVGLCIELANSHNKASIIEKNEKVSDWFRPMDCKYAPRHIPV